MAETITTSPISEKSERWNERYDSAPEGIIANLLPHFAGSPRDIFEERLGRQVINPKQDLPNPVTQRRILQTENKNWHIGEINT